MAAASASAAAPPTAEKSVYALQAEALFNEGRRLMNEGDYAAACPKFADSQSIDPAPGTALNLAVCYEHAGKLASAWSAFRIAEAWALASAQNERALLARKKAAALRPSLSRLTIVVPTGSQVLDVEVSCAGAPVRRSEWGVPISHDGGKYLIEASAPGKKTWTTHVELETSGHSLIVEVPELFDEAPPPEPPAPVPVAGPLRPLQLTPLPTGITALEDIERTIAANNRLPVQRVYRGQTQRAVGLVVGGAGIVTMGAAAIVGLTARKQYDTAVGESGATQHDDSLAAFHSGNTGTLILGIGAITTLVGAGIWAVAPQSPVTVGTDGSKLLVRGRF